VPTHAHLDHIGAIPFLAGFYDAPVICSPFTAAVLKAIITDAGLKFTNEIKSLNVNSAIKVGNLTIEFVSMTHSTPQTVMIVIHTKYGKIIYANDYKFDNYPVLGTKPNFKRLKELGKAGNVLGLMLDSTYSRDHRKMPSESVAREMLKDVILGTNSDGKAVIITTFSSHIARLKSIIEFGLKTGRKIVFLGRSLAKYVAAAEEVGIAKFSNQIEIVKYSSKIRPRLNKIVKDGRDKYLLVVTGHQGEPESTLAKMVAGMFAFERGDHIIFSSTVIPTPTNQRNRQEMEQELDRLGVRIFRDIHVSGHAAREDQRDLIEMVKPKHIIPAHGSKEMTSAVLDLALELGYKEENVHMVSDGEFFELK
jgi:ribonuclease J